MKASWQSLIHFLPLPLNHLRLPSPELDPLLFWLLFRTPCYSAFTISVLPNTSYNHFARTPAENAVFWCQEWMFNGLLPSNNCHSIVEGFCCGNVFTDPLPSNGHTRHNIMLRKIQIISWFTGFAWNILIGEYVIKHKGKSCLTMSHCSNTLMLINVLLHIRGLRD
jgi:hypothetical protein